MLGFFGNKNDSEASDDVDESRRKFLKTSAGTFAAGAIESEDETAFIPLGDGGAKNRQESSDNYEISGLHYPSGLEVELRSEEHIGNGVIRGSMYGKPRHLHVKRVEVRETSDQFFPETKEVISHRSIPIEEISEMDEDHPLRHLRELAPERGTLEEGMATLDPEEANREQERRQEKLETVRNIYEKSAGSEEQFWDKLEEDIETANSTIVDYNIDVRSKNGKTEAVIDGVEEFPADSTGIFGNQWFYGDHFDAFYDGETVYLQFHDQDFEDYRDTELGTQIWPSEKEEPSDLLSEEQYQELESEDGELERKSLNKDQKVLYEILNSAEIEERSYNSF